MNAYVGVDTSLGAAPVVLADLLTEPEKEAPWSVASSSSAMMVGWFSSRSLIIRARTTFRTSWLATLT
jgi:hypothetical protein